MDQEIIKIINKEVYRRFPEIKGKKPKIQVLKLSEKKTIIKPKTYLLVYSGQVNTDTNKLLPRLVRVMATEQGEILKITTSK